MARTTRVRSGLVEVEGLGELGRALRALGPEFAKELRAENKSVAQMVADDARAAAYTIGGVAAKTAPSIKASAGIKSAGVAFGGTAYPFAAGAEFGAYKYHQFKPWRGNGPDAGYFVYPTIRADAEQIVERYTDAANGVIRRNFPH